MKILGKSKILTMSVIGIFIIVLSSCGTNVEIVEIESITFAPTETQTPTPLPTSMPTPTPNITLEPTEYITPTPNITYAPVTMEPETPIPTVNPAQKNSGDIVSQKLSIDDYILDIDGDYVAINVAVPCEFARIYANGIEVPISLNLCDEKEAWIVMEIEEFPCNTIVDLKINFYDEFVYLVASRTIDNVFVGVDLYTSDGYEGIDLSQIGRYKQIEDLAVLYGATGDISSLNSLSDLKRLQIVHCEEITGDIKVVGNFKKLKSFSIYHTYCPSLLVGDVDAFIYCPDLEWVQIYGCEGIFGDIDALEKRGVIVETATLDELGW